MKQVLSGICALIVCTLIFMGCNEERIIYNAGNYVMFSDTISILPVEQDMDEFEIDITAAQACNYDRTFGVEVLENRSNAIEGYHYKIKSNTVTIKAGERATSFKIKGIYDNVAESDSLGVVLRLLTKGVDEWDAYGDANQEIKVLFKKVCPFDINAFTGYLTLQSTWFNDYMVGTDMRLLKSEVDPSAENTIIIRNLFYQGFDVKVRLDNENPLTPNLFMDEHQLMGDTREAFGTVYGNGELMMYQPTIYTSYYSTCEQFMLLYFVPYVEGVGTVGTFVNIMKWISDEEAEYYKRLGY